MQDRIYRLDRTVRRLRLYALAVAVALAGCGDDTSGPDTGPPSVEITSAPVSVAHGQPVEVAWLATDDVGLETISISWGTVEAPVEIRFVSGRVSEGTASHTYGESGTYQITVSASDTHGRMANDFVMTTVEP